MPETEKADKAAAIKAVGNKTITTYAGNVLVFEVTADTRPTVETSDNCPALFVGKNTAGNWASSWVPVEAGEHTVTASIPGADPVVYKVTATEKEN